MFSMHHAAFCLFVFDSLLECLDMDEAIETLFIRDNNGHLNSHKTASGQEAPQFKSSQHKSQIPCKYRHLIGADCLRSCLNNQVPTHCANSGATQTPGF